MAVVALAPVGGLALAGSAAAITPTITPTITEFSTGLTSGGEPSSITAGPDGDMWFLEYAGLGKVGKITTGGAITEVATIGNPPFPSNPQPAGIVAGPDGNLWFTVGKNPGGIGTLTPGTGVVSEVATGGVTPGFTANSGPQGIVVGPDGNLWFGECNNPGAIGRITTAGVVSEFSTGLTANSCPDNITLGPDGNLWFTEASNPARIGRINPTTGSISEFSTGLTSTGSLFTITNGSDGNLWFTEFASPGRVGKITPGGTITEVATGGATPGFSANGNPSWIVAGPDGDLWFTESSNPLGPGRIGRLDPVTGSVEEFPTPTVNSAPNAIAVGPDGNLWFTEFGGSSIGRITTPPIAVTRNASATGPTTGAVSGTAAGHAQATSFRLEYGPVGGATTTTPEQSLGTTTGNVSVSATLTGLQPATTYQARVVVTNPTGTTAGAFLSFTTAAMPTVPALSNLRVSPNRFSLPGRKVRGRCVKPTKKNSGNKRCSRPIRLRVSYTLNVSATVTFTFKRQALGRQVNGRCIKPTAKNSKHRKCTRLIRVRGKIVQSGKAGANHFTFKGKVGGHILGPGTYQLIATLTGGKPRMGTFKVVS